MNSRRFIGAPDEMKAGEPRAIMLRIAEDYDGIAKLVEQQVRDNRKLAASAPDILAAGVSH